MLLQLTINPSGYYLLKSQEVVTNTVCDARQVRQDVWTFYFVLFEMFAWRISGYQTEDVNNRTAAALWTGSKMLPQRGSLSILGFVSEGERRRLVDGSVQRLQ